MRDCEFHFGTQAQNALPVDKNLGFRRSSADLKTVHKGTESLGGAPRPWVKAISTKARCIAALPSHLIAHGFLTIKGKKALLLLEERKRVLHRKSIRLDQHTLQIQLSQQLF